MSETVEIKVEPDLLLQENSAGKINNETGESKEKVVSSAPDIECKQNSISTQSPKSDKGARCDTYEWSNGDALLLIQQYKKHTLLWNPKHQWYFNKIKKKNAWLEISKTCKVDMDEAKKKIGSLLGSFRREKSKGKRIIGTGEDAKEVYKTNWFAFNSLLFLIDKKYPRDIVHTDNLCGDNSKYAETQDNYVDITEPEPTPAVTEINDFMKSITPMPKKSKIQKENPPHVPQVFEKLQRPMPTEDTSMIYAQYIANKLKQFQGRTRAIIEHDINQLIFEAEMGKYDCIPEKPYASTYQHFPTFTSLSPSTSNFITSSASPSKSSFVSDPPVQVLVTSQSFVDSPPEVVTDIQKL